MTDKRINDPISASDEEKFNQIYSPISPLCDKPSRQRKIRISPIGMFGLNLMILRFARRRDIEIRIKGRRKRILPKY